MKILYDYQIFVRQKYGGISRYFYELILQALQQEGIKVSCYQGWHINYYSLAEQKKYFEYYAGSYHKKIYKTGPLLDLYNKTVLKRWLAASPRSFDIYHPTYYNPVKVKAKATVMTVYDMIHEKFPQHLKGAKSFTNNKRKVLARVDKIIAISKSTKNDLIDIFGLPADKIEVVYLAASNHFKPSGQEENNIFRKSHGLDKPYILYVGDRGGYKNFVTLLRAFGQWANRADYYLFCLGGQSKWGPEELALINKYRIAGNLKIFSGINDLELRLFYANAKMLVVTSLYEGFGLTPLEAMKCGTPVIVSNSSS
ncbi:MAG: glycosyltransferase family 1 protein, partial [bacterium]|nr:glycosyltransferase family 1 protein [bacterium]